MPNFKELVEMSVSENKMTSVEVDLELDINGETWCAYECSISNRDLLFFCDKGCANFLIDKYGNRYLAELFDYEQN